MVESFGRRDLALIGVGAGAATCVALHLLGLLEILWPVGGLIGALITIFEKLNYALKVISIKENLRVLFIALLMTVTALSGASIIKSTYWDKSKDKSVAKSRRTVKTKRKRPIRRARYAYRKKQPVVQVECPL